MSLFFLIPKVGNASVANKHRSRINQVPNKMPTEIIITMKPSSTRRWVGSFTSQPWMRESFKTAQNLL